MLLEVFSISLACAWYFGVHLVSSLQFFYLVLAIIIFIFYKVIKLFFFFTGQ